MWDSLNNRFFTYPLEKFLYGIMSALGLDSYDPRDMSPDYLYDQLELNNFGTSGTGRIYFTEYNGLNEYTDPETGEYYVEINGARWKPVSLWIDSDGSYYDGPAVNVDLVFDGFTQRYLDANGSGSVDDFSYIDDDGIFFTDYLRPLFTGDGNNIISLDQLQSRFYPYYQEYGDDKIQYYYSAMYDDLFLYNDYYASYLYQRYFSGTGGEYLTGDGMNQISFDDESGPWSFYFSDEFFQYVHTGDGTGANGKANLNLPGIDIINEWEEYQVYAPVGIVPINYSDMHRKYGGITFQDYDTDDGYIFEEVAYDYINIAYKVGYSLSAESIVEYEEDDPIYPVLSLNLRNMWAGYFYGDTTSSFWVHFSDDGGSGGAEDFQVFDSGDWPSSVTVPTHPSGYPFLGYYDGYTQYYDASGRRSGSTSMRDDDLYLTAKWDKPVLPSYSGGNGEYYNPYKIKTRTDLETLAKTVNAGEKYVDTYFEQTADITLSSSNWTPIGAYQSSGAYFSTYFAGHYDGGDHKISGLTITSTTQNNYKGLFGFVKGVSGYAKIENVNLSGTIAASQYVGGLVAVVGGNTDITRCRVDVAITASERVGGVVGIVENIGTTISRCINFGSLTNNDLASGGIVGSLGGSGNYIRDCLNYGNVKASSSAGGIVGECSGSVERSISKAKIEITSAPMSICGGIVGYLSGTLTNCAAYGEIVQKGTKNGGLVGSCAAGARIQYCSFVGTSSSSLSLYGGTNAPTMSACYQKCNSTISRSSTVDSSWSSYWAVIQNLNDGLPMQKALYQIATVGDSSVSALSNVLK